MSNLQLEENIRNLSADYIYQESVSSLLLLLLSAVEDESRQKPLFASEVHEDILEIKKAIRRFIVQLETLLDTDTDERLTELEKCLALKKKLLQQYETIYGYFSLWNVFSTALGNETALRKYKKEGIGSEKLQWEVFFADCHDFLHNADTVLDQKKYIGQLLKCIPLKMARERYFDLVRESLELAFNGESKEYIEASLRAFEGFLAPEHVDGYGRYFPEIAKWLSSKNSLTPSALTDELLEQEFDEFQEVFQTLTDIEDYFNCIFSDINALILLLSLTYSFDDLTQEDVAYSDLYHAVSEIINGEVHEAEKEAILDAAIETLNTAIESIIDKANHIGKKELSIMEKVGDFSGLSEDTKKVLLTEDFVRTCFYAELNNELFRFGLSEDLPEADESFKAAAFEGFISNVRNYIGTLPVVLRRVCQEMLLGALPPALSVQEAMAMMQDAVNGAVSVEEKILILDKAGLVFQDNHFKSRFDEEPHSCSHDHSHSHIHGHHHGHDCSCGHHHK